MYPHDVFRAFPCALLLIVSCDRRTSPPVSSADATERISEGQDCTASSQCPHGQACAVAPGMAIEGVPPEMGPMAGTCRPNGPATLRRAAPVVEEDASSSGAPGGVAGLCA